MPMNHRVKQILATGDMTSPKTAMKFAKKSGNLNHLYSMCITVRTKKTLQMIANLAINAKKALLKIALIICIEVQDKKITQKGFLVVGL
jgi:hypothetical protein